MHPPFSPPSPITDLGRPPGPVRGLAVTLWIAVGLSSLLVAFSMFVAAMVGGSPAYAFGYTLPRALPGLLLAVAATPMTRGRPWARMMVKVLLIVQIVFQSLMFLGGNSLMALLLIPLAITGLVLLHRPMSVWFFTVHRQIARGEYAGQPYAAHHPQTGYGHQDYQGHYGHQGYHPHQQSPQHPPQSHGQQQQDGSWGQGPHPR
ncbi:hypothetical protein ABZ635_08635 [Nocardiopsis sp. NPDC007018]|uniref:hypothetical protein n=1 Tax=Nocardiopsis sp. NPDC007018 TaxID=3155721 RepID=UPI0033D987C1